MSRLVYCVKLKKESKGLEIAPLPGEKGQWIFDNISQEVWNEWQQHQTRLINERKLNLLDPKIRSYLLEQMDKFFSGKEIDHAEGYQPEH